MHVQFLGYRTDLMFARLQGAVVADGGDYLVLRTPDNLAFHWGNYVLAGQPWLARPLADLSRSFTPNTPGLNIWQSGSTGWSGAMTRSRIVVSRLTAAW